MTKEATIIITCETELKEFLKSVAESKRMSLSEYIRHVLNRGLDTIHQSNLELSAHEAQLQKST